jgi:hypothetical protein
MRCDAEEDLHRQGCRTEGKEKTPGPTTAVYSRSVDPHSKAAGVLRRSDGFAFPPWDAGLGPSISGVVEPGEGKRGCPVQPGKHIPRPVAPVRSISCDLQPTGIMHRSGERVRVGTGAKNAPLFFARITSRSAGGHSDSNHHPRLSLPSTRLSVWGVCFTFCQAIH